MNLALLRYRIVGWTSLPSARFIEDVGSVANGTVKCYPYWSHR